MSDKNTMALVHSTESFGSVDGPGVRFIGQNGMFSTVHKSISFFFIRIGAN